MPAGQSIKRQMREGSMWDFIKVAKEKRLNHNHKLQPRMAEDEDPKESLDELHAFLFGIKKCEERKERKERIVSENTQESVNISGEKLPLKRDIRSQNLSVDFLKDPAQVKRAKL